MENEVWELMTSLTEVSVNERLEIAQLECSHISTDTLCMEEVEPKGGSFAGSGRTQGPCIAGIA